MIKRFYIKGYACLCLFIVFLLTSCATPIKTEQSLNEVITQYWSLRLADKYEDTYKMESRDGLPDFKDYETRARLIRRFEIRSFSILKTEVEGNKAVATIELLIIMPPVTKPFKNILSDEWRIEEGRWRHVFN